MSVTERRTPLSLWPLIFAKKVEVFDGGPHHTTFSMERFYEGSRVDFARRCPISTR